MEGCWEQHFIRHFDFLNYPRITVFNHVPLFTQMAEESPSKRARLDEVLDKPFEHWWSVYKDDIQSKEENAINALQMHQKPSTPDDPALDDPAIIKVRSAVHVCTNL
jgi:hypothetical protein